MIKDIFTSLIGHAVVFAAILVPSMLKGSQVEIRPIYTVRTVTPESVQRLLASSAPQQAQRNERIPQVNVKKEDEELPNPTYKPKQVVKQEQPQPKTEEKPKTAPQPETKPAAQKAETEFAGIRLDNDFDYPEYLLDMQRRIQSNWLPPTLRDSLITRIFFRIGKDGRILRVRVETPSGNVSFDQSSLKAVTLSGPFPPLPDDYDGDDLGVHFDFIYEM